MFKVIWVAGMPRSGSMWTYNVARELARRTGYRVLPETVFVRDEDAGAYANREIAANKDPMTVFIIKIHARLAPLPADNFVITNLRDPRDAVVSYMRFMRTDFHQALSAIRADLDLADYYRSLPEDRRMVLRYENITGSPLTTAAGIAERIGLGVDQEIVADIALQFGKDRVKAMIQKQDRRYQEARDNDRPFLGEMLLVRGEGDVTTIDQTTGFQTDHVSDYRDGSWHQVLTAGQIARMNQAFGDWLARNGYEV